MYEKLTICFTIIVLIISSITDLKKRKIYNVITFPTIITGIVFSIIYAGLHETGIRLLFLIVFFVLGSYRLLGMGDIKLCMAIIAMRGGKEGALMFFYGALLMILYCFITVPNETIESLKNTYFFIFYKTPIIRTSTKEYPFAVFLFLGYIMAHFSLIYLRGWFFV